MHVFTVSTELEDAQLIDEYQHSIDTRAEAAQDLHILTHPPRARLRLLATSLYGQQCCAGGHDGRGSSDECLQKVSF